MTRWRRALAAVDRSARFAVELGWRVVLWPALYAVAWAAGVWPLLHQDRLLGWAKNDLDRSEQLQQLNLLLGFLVGFGIFLVGFLVARRVATGRWRVWERARSFNRLFAFSLSVPFLAGLTTPSIELREPLVTILFVVAATVCLLPTAALAWEAVPRGWLAALRRRAPRLGALVPIAAVLGLFASYAAWFSQLAINNHHALQTRIFDLAIYDNIFFHSSHGNPLGCSLSSTNTHINAHFDPILVLLSPLYLIDPRAETILILQAVWCAAGVVPAYLLGKDHVGSVGAGLALAVAWAVYPALHGANLYEFHSLTLLAMPMLWVMYFLTTGRVGWFLALLPVVLLIREDASLLICSVAFTALLTRDPSLTRVGWFTFIVAGAYFIVTKTVIMASVGVDPTVAMEQIDPLGGKHGFAWYYTDLIPKGGGFHDLVRTLFTNPLFVLDVVIREKKLIFLLQLLVPLAFLPLFGRPWRFATAFGLFYLLLASKGAVFSAHFQYSVVLFPVLFALSALGLRNLRNGPLPGWLGFRRAQLASVLLTALVISSLLMSWKFGGIAPNAAFRGGWQKIPRSLTEKQKDRYAELRDFLEQIPEDASVTAIGRMGPHVSNREKVYKYRHGRPSEYLLFDTRDMRGRARTSFRKRLADGELSLVDRKGTFELYEIVEADQAEP